MVIRNFPSHMLELSSERGMYLDTLKCAQAKSLPHTHFPMILI